MIGLLNNSEVSGHNIPESPLSEASSYLERDGHGRKPSYNFNGLNDYDSDMDRHNRDDDDDNDSFLSGSNRMRDRGLRMSQQSNSDHDGDSRNNLHGINNNNVQVGKMDSSLSNDSYEDREY